MKSFLILAVCILFFAGMIQAAGELDPLFGNGGKVTTDLGFGDIAAAVVLQPDGKIIAAGSTGNPPDFALVRYNLNGTLDPTFGVGGIVTTDFFGDAETLRDIELQNDGKIVAVGSTRSTPTDPTVIALARYNPDGSLDPTFGSGGEATASLPGLVFGVSAAAIQSDGKIVVSGISAVFNDNTDSSCFVARFNIDGSLDSSFAGGIIIKDFGGTVGNEAFADVTVQSDDKIVVAGTVPGINSQDLHDFVTVRYNPNGSQDPTFGSGGIVITDLVGGVDNAVNVKVQPDGKILVAGPSSSVSPFKYDFGVVRYNPNGSLDPTFGNGGIVRTDISGTNDFAAALAVQPNGKIIVVGSAESDFGLVRYNPNGSLDPTFDGDGKVVTDFNSDVDGAQDVALQPDGKIVVSGFAKISSFDFALARYNGDIVLPPTCGLYSDDFEDGVLATNWTYVKPAWTEVGGNLEGTPTGGKAEAIATPAFAGCGTGACSVQTTIQTAGGVSNKIFFFAWYQDKQNTIEVLMKEENDKWVIKQFSNGAVVAKEKASATINPNIFYDVRVSFDGTQFTLTVDGVDLVSMTSGAAPSGTIGYRVKNTTGRFGNICAD